VSYNQKLLSAIAIVTSMVCAADAGAAKQIPPKITEVLKKTDAFAIARVTKLERNKRSECTTETVIRLKPTRSLAGPKPPKETLVFSYLIHAYFGPKGGCPSLHYRIPFRAANMKSGMEVIAALELDPKTSRHRVIGTFDLPQAEKLKRLFQGNLLGQILRAEDGQPLFRGNSQQKVFHSHRCKEAACEQCKDRFLQASRALKAGYRPHQCVKQGMKGVDVPLEPRQPWSRDRICRTDKDCKLRPGRPCSCSPCGTFWAKAINLKGHRALMRRWNRCRRRACPRCHPTILGKEVFCKKGQCTIR